MNAAPSLTNAEIGKHLQAAAAMLKGTGRLADYQRKGPRPARRRIRDTEGATGCVSLNLPFGIAISGSAVAEPGLHFNPMLGFLANMNSTLAPFMPIFKIVGFAKDLVDCLNAVPKSIASLNPQPFVSALVKVVEDLDELLEVLPQTSVPVMLRDLIGALITMLQGTQSMLAGLQIQASFSVGLAATAATLQETNPDAYAELIGISNSITADQASYTAALDAQSCAFNELCKTIKIVAELLGLPAPPLLPCFDLSADLSPTAWNDALQAAIDALQDAIEVLEALGLVLGGASEPSEPC